MSRITMLAPHDLSAELVAVLGYYCFVALRLNALELGLPDNVAPELS